ncbi:MAG: LacI family DNA-binding transcriptional regulator [Clostridiales bacterium]|nr:LacI family DNA-binding transcriptional regulator [Clostridiales bacterium]
MAVTLQQIADAAGVSRGTVDRALNNRGRINPDVAKKIKKLAAEMGYQPNRAGRALALSCRSITIGVILQAADTPFMKKVLMGIAKAKEEVERLGAAVVVEQIRGVDAEKVIFAMKKMRESGCNGIALVAVEDQHLRLMIKEFSEAGIPIITFNSDLEQSGRLCFVGQNSLQSGKTAAGLMTEILPPGAAVQIISGYPHNQSHRDRCRGFAQELVLRRGNSSQPEVHYAYDDDAAARKITRELLDKYGESLGIYVAASGVEGICEAIRERGLAGKVKVISNDLTLENEEELRRGTIQFLIGQDAYRQGYAPVAVLFYKLFDGKDPEQEYDYTEIVIKTKYNL